MLKNLFSTSREKRLTSKVAITAAATALIAGITPASIALANNMHAAVPKPTVVLVHGAWADSSSFTGVTTRLQHDGYTVDVLANPLRGVATDAAYLAAYLKTITGPVVLVGHSYGGFITTNAAVGNPQVKALVYVDAYLPDAGDTLLSLTSQFPGSEISPAVLNTVPNSDGVIDTYIKADLFPGIFANDLPKSQGAALAAEQRPVALTGASEPSGTPAWKAIPSWDLIGTEDNVIPVAAQKFMANRAHAHTEVIKASHLSLISRPQDVEHIIEQAATSTATR